MAIRISDLDPLGSGLKKNDKFEVTKTDEGKSYSCTPEDILNYCKNTTNGAFRGNTTESLANMTADYIGVWQWSGSDGPNNISIGIVEVISQYSKDDTNGAPDIIQRFTSGHEVYQRMMMDGGSWSAWASLTNKNGCAIKYGVSSDATTLYGGTQEHPFTFASTPSVICIPLNTSAEAYANIINVTAVSPSEFTVVRYRSSLTSVVTKEITTVTETNSSKTTNTTVETTRGEWEAGDFSFYWIALLEEG